MARPTYWSVREHRAAAVVRDQVEDGRGAVLAGTSVAALCGTHRIQDRDVGRWDGQAAGDRLGRPICPACLRRIDALHAATGRPARHATPDSDSRVRRQGTLAALAARRVARE